MLLGPAWGTGWGNGHSLPYMAGSPVAEVGQSSVEAFISSWGIDSEGFLIRL
jgi:hypothetical protein